MSLRFSLAASVAISAILACGHASAGDVKACNVEKSSLTVPNTSSPPTGVTGSTVNTMAGVGSNNDMGMTTGVKQTTAGSVDLKGGYQGVGSNNVGFGVNAANNGKQAQTTNQIGFNGASVGGLGSNGGNGELNLNNGGMAGVSKDGGSPDKGSNYNWGGYGETVNSYWGALGHPKDGKDSHGNTWSGGKLSDGYDQNGVQWMNGKPYQSPDNKPDSHGGHWDHGTYRDQWGKPATPPKDDDGGGDGGHSEPGADTGVSDGPGGTNANGVAVNVGNKGGNDGGTPGNGGTSGGATTSGTGATLNLGGYAGNDAGLVKPKTIEAVNSNVLSNGVTDPCPGTGASFGH